MTVSWPKTPDSFVLDETVALTLPWSPVAPAVYQSDATKFFVTLPAPAGNRFYRLRKP